MRLSVIVLFAASLVSAFTLPKRNNDQPPECAVKCAEEQGNPDPCKSDDVPCICLNFNYGTKVADCVKSKCSQDDVQKATDYGKAICKNAGVDLENPIPECAVTCEQNAPTDGCDVNDGKCLCESKDFIQSIVDCTTKSCGSEDTKKAAFVGEALCRAYGVDISSTVGGY